MMNAPIELSSKYARTSMLLTKVLSVNQLTYSNPEHSAYKPDYSATSKNRCKIGTYTYLINYK
jgi:hypothetical protein